MKGLKVWTAMSGESTTVVEEMQFEVQLGNGKTYTIWNKTEVNGLDRYYLSQEERNNDIVPKLLHRIGMLETVIQDRIMHKALTIFVKNDDQVNNFFAPLEKALK